MQAFPQRLKAARLMAGLSLRKLADRLEGQLSYQAINKYEKGELSPSSSVLIALAKALSVDIDYFMRPTEASRALEQVDYRRVKSKLGKRAQLALEQSVMDALERYDKLERIMGDVGEKHYFNYKATVRQEEDALRAADALRQEWNLGYDPIPDVVKMLEDKGYKILIIAAPEGFDGMKADWGDDKVIVLPEARIRDSDKVRIRFTALHELAHHGLTFSDDLEEKEVEQLCHVFASAVLYPSAMALRELGSHRDRFFLQEWILIKERWGISLSALAKRANQLDIISDYRYRQINIQFRQRGWHRPDQEPGTYTSKEQPTRQERLLLQGLAMDLLSLQEAAHLGKLSPLTLREKIRQPLCE